MPELERTKLAIGRTARSNCSPDKIANVKNTFQHARARARAHTHSQTTILSLLRARSPSFFLYLPRPPLPPPPLHIPTYSHTDQERDLCNNAPTKSSPNPCYPLGRRRNAGTANGTTTCRNALISLGRLQPQAGCDDAVTWPQPQAGTGV